ncbi:MAG: TadE family protein [Myxococcota bacterium]
MIHRFSPLDRSGLASRSTRRSRRRGANAIEFALTLPMFLFVVLGVMDYGFLFAMQAGIDNAVSMSCREGSMRDPDRAIQPVTEANNQFAARSGTFCGAGECNFDAEDLQTGIYAKPNRTIHCTAVRTMTPLTGFVPYPATIQSQSFYRLEWQ